jgi:hypothetical protein
MFGKTRHGRAYYNCYPANNNIDRLDRYPADYPKAIYVREDALVEALGRVIATRVFGPDRHALLRRGLAGPPSKRRETETRRADALRDQIADLTARRDRLIEELETADGAFRDRLRRRFEALEVDCADKLARLHLVGFDDGLLRERDVSAMRHLDAVEALSRWYAIDNELERAGMAQFGAEHRAPTQPATALVRPRTGGRGVLGAGGADSDGFVVAPLAEVGADAVARSLIRRISPQCPHRRTGLAGAVVARAAEWSVRFALATSAVVFELTVIGFDRIVGMPFDVVPGLRDQLIQHGGVGRGGVGDDLAGCHLHRRQRPSKEPPYPPASRLGRDQHVDDLPVLVDRPVHVPPHPIDLDVRLINEPPVAW